MEIVLKDFDRLRLSNHSSSYGVSQMMYETKWQQMAGCAPTVATNIVIYSSASNSFTLNDGRVLMHEIWEYITPGFMGVNSTRKFIRGFEKYLGKGFQSWQYRLMDVKSIKSEERELTGLVAFLQEGLLKNAPVAWLNLDSGLCKNLDSWHWMMIYGLAKNNDRWTIKVLDNGQLLVVDLELWYQTTKLGGGFVWLTPKPL
jgi:hypothetical protein